MQGRYMNAASTELMDIHFALTVDVVFAWRGCVTPTLCNAQNVSHMCICSVPWKTVVTLVPSVPNPLRIRATAYGTMSARTMDDYLVMLCNGPQIDQMDLRLIIGTHGLV